MKKTIKTLVIIIPIIICLLIMVFMNTAIVSSIENWVYFTSTESMSSAVINVMKYITYMGSSIVVLGLCLILFIPARIRKKYAIPITITVAISGTLNYILKNIFERERPNILRLVNETSYSFPSGHSMTNMAMYSMMVLLIWKYTKNTKIRVLSLIFCTILVILIGFSRVYLGVHYITDVIGGWCIGLLVAIVIYHIWKKKIKTDSMH